MSQFRRYRKRQSEAEWIKWSLVSLALGVIVFIGWRAFVMYQVNQMFQGIVQNTQASTQRILQQEKDRQTALTRQREEKAHREAQATTLQRQADKEARERFARKQAAWNQFFKPSKQCQDDPVTVECANAHIRAKGKFEETYRETL